MGVPFAGDRGLCWPDAGVAVFSTSASGLWSTERLRSVLHV